MSQFIHYAKDIKQHPFPTQRSMGAGDT